jgi:hypothetical protein
MAASRASSSRKRRSRIAHGGIFGPPYLSACPDPAPGKNCRDPGKKFLLNYLKKNIFCQKSCA